MTKHESPALETPSSEAIVPFNDGHTLCLLCLLVRDMYQRDVPFQILLAENSKGESDSREIVYSGRALLQILE